MNRSPSHMNLIKQLEDALALTEHLAHGPSDKGVPAATRA
jgi:hypothetical protein